MTGKSLLTYALCFFLGACAFQKDDAKKETTPQATPDVVESVEKVSFNGELNEKNVKIEFLDAETPGVYQLVITWPEDVPAMKVSVRGMPYEIIKASKFSTTIEQGSKFTVHLVALNKIGGESSAYTADLTSPKDTIISDDMVISSDTVITSNRVFFTKNGRIITNGFNVSISTTKLILDASINESHSRMHVRDAHILTIAPGTKAPGIEFLKGSNIVIRAKKATGHLRVAMVGFNGINGATGANGTTGAVGKNGRDGEIKNFAELCVNDNGRPCRGPSQVECVTKPTNGETGGAGTAGIDGNAGSNGGNSGVLTAIIEDHTQFKLEVAQRRGLGGHGGVGGKGGAGGAGGAAGNNPLNKCANASNGATGAQGADGKIGQDGSPGLLDDVITNISNFSRYEIE